uniref:Integrase catalytic domain-containing protein n=1 Tax=Meloidogyne enterolobii TaxID=390850 RepID=A0A6V7Y327_MELEN|nr:unnamed protein product [Meloidogyne enterolobii]
MRMLSEQNRCLLCLKKGHAKIDCRNKIRCNVCNGDHNRIICPKLVEKERKGEDEGKSEAREKNITKANVLSVENRDKNEVLLMKADFKIRADNAITYSATGIFDSGATVNFISDEKVKEMRLKKINKADLNIYPFMQKQPTRLGTACYLVKILTDRDETEEIVAYKIKKNLMPSIKYADITTGEIKSSEIVPDILISIKHFWRFFNQVKHLSDYLFKVETSVGPIICGEIINKDKKEISQNKNLVAILGSKETKEGEDMNNFWNLETIGVRDDPRNKDDEVAMKFFEDTVKRSEHGRYIVKWPWKVDKSNLASNFSLSYKRFLSLFEKLKKTPELFEKYDNIIRDDEKRGVIELAERNKDNVEHFLPHHPVITPKKIRIVYDASARVKGGKSLNDHLYRGPIIMPDLAGLLIRFRIPKIAMWSDIEKAFHALELDPEDREVVKFIWVKDIREPISLKNIQYYRFSKVPFGVISSPFLLSATVSHHLGLVDDPVAKIAKKNAYVDNLLIGVETKEEGWDAYIRLKEIFKSADMNLREFITNNEQLNSSLPIEDRLEKSEPKVLGIPWNIKNDKIIVKFPLINYVKITKRNVLCQLASIFDPLGFASPSLLEAKLFFQSLWESKKEWDENLREEEAKEWINITKAWETPDIELDRRIIQSEYRCQLHVFSDASKNAYAACVYVLTRNNDTTMIHLVYARNRLRPKKMPISIPRMELLGVVIATRIIKFVERQIGIEVNEKYLWCDSKSVLYWIKNNQEKEKFVQNRIKEIRTNIDLKFGYVPTEGNPADIGTRGCTPLELRANKQWWYGPVWLEGPKENWPNELNFQINEEKSENELEERTAGINICANNFKDENFIEINDWSNWLRLIRCIARVSKIAKNWLNRCKIKITSEILTKIDKENPINVTDMRESEKIIYRMVQKSLINSKNNNIKLVKDSDGILHLQSRINNCEADDGFKHPIVLPKGNPVIKLIMKYEHERLLHSGVDATLGAFLSKFWAPCSRRDAKIIVKSCKKCQRIIGPTFSLPEMPNHPKERVCISRPFESVGIDYLGPSICKIDGNKQKFWIVLFTCFTTRAIHLEIAFELTALAFLHALRRFIAQRGVPAKIISDNANQFKVVSKSIDAKIVGKWSQDKQPENNKFNNFIINRGIEWKFIPALSPWQGGIYERLVKLVKRFLLKRHLVVQF